jgi:hypothetical protein
VDKFGGICQDPRELVRRFEQGHQEFAEQDRVLKGGKLVLREEKTEGTEFRLRVIPELNYSSKYTLPHPARW